MSETNESTIETLEDALAALRKVRKADEAKRKRIDALEAEVDAAEAKLPALAAYEALGAADDLKARLSAGEAALKALEASGVSPEELPAKIKEANEAAALRSKMVYIEAAGSDFDPDKLKRIAPGLSARTVKGEDGEVTEYGIPGDGDAWTPLNDAVKGWEASLKREAAAAPETPAPTRPLPTGGAGSKPAAKTVEQRTAEVRKEISI